jgi:hypothetical protein
MASLPNLPAQQYPPPLKLRAYVILGNCLGYDAEAICICPSNGTGVLRAFGLSDNPEAFLIAQAAS